MQNKWKMIATTAVLLCGAVNADDGDMSSSYGKKANKMQPMMRQGEIVTADQMQSGYNAPAAVNPMGDWDMFITASYTFWDFYQDGMELGSLSSTVAGQPTGVLTYDDKYKSGFKVAMGWHTDFDNWVVKAEYTWFHHEIFKNQPDSSFLWSTLLSGGVKVNASTVGNQFSSSHNKWKMHLDVGDLMLSRPFYQGTHLTVNPFCGVRGAWIRQEQTATGTVVISNTRPAGSATVKSRSWAVGPRIGMDANYLLGDGFRIEGSSALSVLFTQYNTHYYFGQQSTLAATTAKRKNQNTVRPNAEASLGIAWGDYLDNQTYYLDIALDYTFNMWWSQNVMNAFVNSLAGFGSTNAGDLYMQGLTATIRFDF